MEKKRNINKLVSRLNLDCSIKAKDGEEHNFHRGHEYIDLGLPSGTLWATCNVGAESETEYGNYYMCGMGSKTYNITDAYCGYENPLNPSVDTAVQVWGGEWHMPTEYQMKELITKTNYQWIDGYKGRCLSGGLFTSKKNGKSVFLPACGYYHANTKYFVGTECLYWTSSTDCITSAHYLFLSSDIFTTNQISRFFGFSVRPVLK